MTYGPESPFLELLFTLFGSCPLLIIFLVGIVLALTRWSRNPRPALFTLLAFAAFLILHVSGVVFFVFGLPAIMNWASMEYEGYRLTVAGARFVWNIGEATLFGILIAAVFMGRKNEAAPGPRRYEDERDEGPARPSRKDTNIQEGRSD